MRVKLLVWLLKFIYRRLTKICKQQHVKPIGIPLQRDPDNPCDMYEPTKRGQFAFDDCETDGHYLCRKCVHNVNNTKNIQMSL